LGDLNRSLNTYFDESDDEVKNETKQEIIRLLDRSIEFAAFKRDKIRSNKLYMHEFGKYLS